MMPGYLIDTHILIWWLEGSEKLSTKVRDVLKNGENTIYFSSGAIWEMVIKQSLGRLDMPDNIEDVLRSESIDVLPITAPHALAVADRPHHHRDPFDRIQIAQAQHEGLVLISQDREFEKYAVRLLKA